jgi:hypothetical protein
MLLLCRFFRSLCLLGLSLGFLACFTSSFADLAQAQLLKNPNKIQKKTYNKSLQPLPMHPVEEVWSMFVLPKYFGENENGLLIFRPGKKITGVYRVIDDKLRYLKRMKPWAYIGEATTMQLHGETRIVVGYEYRIVDEKKKWLEKDSVLVIAYDRELDKYEELFYARTPVPTINFLKELDGKLWLNYFHEEDFSKGGYFENLGPKKWKFKRVFAGWKQDTIDIVKGLVAVGSKYSDDSERAKELVLFKNEEWLPLPSKRGVQSLGFGQMDSDPELEIVLADSLPNSRDKRGRPELSYIDFDSQSQTYSRVQIDKIGRTQREFRHVYPFTHKNKPRLLVRGDLYIDLYTRDGDKWSRDRIYSRKDRNSEARLEAVVLTNTDKDLIFTILDDTEAMLYRYVGEKG